jgi:protein-disulfide isomerase
MDTFKGKVRLVIKNYPYKYRDYSFIAAEASLAARDQGKYWEMHDLLFQNSPRLSREDLIRYAKELGLDLRRFTESIDQKKHRAEIDRDLQLALSLDLYNTPTFFINGRKVVGDVPYDFLKKMVEEDLSHAKN